MKRRDLVKRLHRIGCEMVRRGAKHDLYQNTRTGKKQTVPRHTEIDEYLARHILKELTQ
jgi:predicted RNA binding protein YcfA (HicA-like mRNA interferase family)